MPDVLLQDYLEEISTLIDESRLGEAVRHCRYILQQYPRHVDTYRLLGKAFLEQGELQAAADVFRRVLSADPEDFIAHAGMAILYKQEDEFKQAIWHMERAFEVDPYNGAIQEALKDLYGRRDGLPPDQLPLTRGALSRLYVKGEMYAQAITELNELVQEDDSRIDLQVLLAEALWRDDQRVDAVEICQPILEQLPDCIKANAILGEVWLMTGRHDEARAYVQRVYELVLPAHDVLDNDSPVARLFRTNGAMDLPAQIFVERLQESAALGMAPETDDWVQDLDLDDDDLLAQVEPEWLEVLQSEEPSAAAEAYDDEYEWLHDVAGPDDGSEAATDHADEAEDQAARAAVDAPEDAESIPTRWLAPEDELTGLGEAPGDADWEHWLQDEPESDPLPSPDLQRENSDSEEVAMGAMDEYGQDRDEMPEDEIPGMDDEQSSGEDAFDWLQELGDAEEGAESEQPQDVESDDLPDWLAEEGAAPDEADETLQWLEEMADADDVDDVEEGAADELPRGDLPDWLMEDAASAEADDDEDLSWLDQIAAGEGSVIEEPPTMSWPEDEMEQPQEATGDEAMAEGPEATEPADASEPLATDAEDVADVDQVPVGPQSEGEALDDVPEDLEDAMAWLEQLAAQQGAPAEELPSLSDRSEEDEDDALLGEMPEDIDDAMAWLDDLSEEELDDEPVLPAAAGEPFEEASGDESPAEEEVFDYLADEETILDVPADDMESPEQIEEAADIPDESSASDADWLEELDETPLQESDELLEESEAGTEEPLAQAAEEESWDDLDWLEELGDEVEVDEAWLDELAETEEGEPVADSVAAQAEVDEPADEAPEDLDEAMAWLEQLAARQGAPTDELPSLDEFVDPEADAEAMADLEDIPEDPEAALAWLEALAEGEGAGEEDADVVEEPPTPAAPHDVVAARAEAEAILLRDEMDDTEETSEELFEEMPEDPDEAMAWLERLAARQGAPLDELPTVTEAEDAEADVETPEWIAREAAEVEAEPEPQEEAPAAAAPVADADVAGVTQEPEEHEPEPVDEPPQLPEQPELPEQPMVVDEESVQDAEDDVESEVERALMSELVDDELEESLPSWLDLEDEAVDELGWETAEADITGWLQAEEESTQHEMEVPAPPDLPASSEAEPAAMEDREEPAPVPEVPAKAAPAPTGAEAWAPAVEGMDGEKLEAARRALRAGEVDAAEVAYRQLLEAAQGTSVLVADLETATSESGDRPQLWQLLGDAYMQNGQLQKALDAYRQALDML